MDNSSDFIATELLRELKDSNTRKDQYIAQSEKYRLFERIGFLAVILCIVVGFLLYLNQYDFSSTSSTSNTAEGFYAVVDSDGNVIASDLPIEEIEGIVAAYGEGSKEDYSNSSED